MAFRRYGKTDKMVSGLGFGSTRFNPNDLNDEAGLERCASLIVEAASLGVNYFDIAGNYSKSQCERIYHQAFQQIKTPYYVTSKSSSFQDNTADQVLRRVEQSLQNLGVNKIHFFYMWSIMDEAHFLDIMKKGGAYEGALRAKEQGLIEHIVFSNHAVPKTAIKIIETGAFEGVTLSYNVLNYKLMAPVIEAAVRQQMGITVMNPLAGGLIPQNLDFFSQLLKTTQQEVVSDAMAFIYANPHITSVLSGISSSKELHENIAALSKYPGEAASLSLIKGVEDNMQSMSGLCTGCGYCVSSCPKSLPIPEYMQSYNMSLFGGGQQLYGRKDPALLKRISVLKKLSLDFQMVPQGPENLCIACGACEKICTQHLPISQRMAEIAQWVEGSCGSKTQYLERLKDRLFDKGYEQVVLYTAGGYTAFVLEQIRQNFSPLAFDIHIVDSNASRWGETLAGYTIKSPADLQGIQPDCVLIANYIYSEEIYESLAPLRAQGMNVLKLHELEDVPWVF